MWRRRTFSLIGLIVAGVLAAGTTNGGGGSSSTVRLNATVHFTGTQVVVKNKDSFNWSNVKLEVNPGLVSGGYVLNVPTMKAGETYTVGALQFAKSDGERFNPFTHKPQKFSIWCDTPKGKGFYSGEWK